MTPFQFDARQVAPASAEGSSNLPVGKYPAQIIAGEFKPVKDNPNAGYLALTLEAIQGSQFAGAKGVWRLNLYSNSEQARDIANRQMSSLCHVTNTFIVNNVEDLFGKPFVVVVEPQADARYTQVSGVLFMDGRDPGKPGAAPQQLQAPQQAPQQQANGFGAPQGAPGFGQPVAAPAQGFGQPPAGFAPSQAAPAPQQGFAPQPGAQQHPMQQQPTQQWQPQGQPMQQPQQTAAPAGWGGAPAQGQPPAAGAQPWMPGR